MQGNAASRYDSSAIERNFWLENFLGNKGRMPQSEPDTRGDGWIEAREKGETRLRSLYNETTSFKAQVSGPNLSLSLSLFAGTRSVPCVHRQFASVHRMYNFPSTYFIPYAHVSWPLPLNFKKTKKSRFG